MRGDRMPPGVSIVARGFDSFGVFGCFFRSDFGYGGGDSRKAECDGLGELEIVFDAVIWEKVASVLVFA